jgi:hypothetical protein
MLTFAPGFDLTIISPFRLAAIDFSISEFCALQMENPISNKNAVIKTDVFLMTSRQFIRFMVGLIG